VGCRSLEGTGLEAGLNRACGEAGGLRRQNVCAFTVGPCIHSLFARQANQSTSVLRTGGRSKAGRLGTIENNRGVVAGGSVERAACVSAGPIARVVKVKGGARYRNAHSAPEFSRKLIVEAHSSTIRLIAGRAKDNVPWYSMRDESASVSGSERTKMTYPAAGLF
jgi:hypothetical protein